MIMGYWPTYDKIMVDWMLMILLIFIAIMILPVIAVGLFTFIRKMFRPALAGGHHDEKVKTPRVSA
jgi:hypothetical protein